MHAAIYLSIWCLGKRARGEARGSTVRHPKLLAQESTNDDRYVNIRHFFDATNALIESARKARGVALVHCNSASFSRAAAISMGEYPCALHVA